MLPFIHPLLCGPEFNSVKRQIPRCLKEYNFLLKMAKEKGWQELPSVLEPLHNPETAIVITDVEERIEWVNEGFFNMTGYLFEEVVSRKPDFLQGKDTNIQDVHKVRHLIDKNEPFTAVIMNYRKSGEAYHCKIKVYPIFDRKQKLINFLAVENEIFTQAG